MATGNGIPMSATAPSPRRLIGVVEVYETVEAHSVMYETVWPAKLYEKVQGVRLPNADPQHRIYTKANRPGVITHWGKP
jgi:hypothetical protein